MNGWLSWSAFDDYALPRSERQCLPDLLRAPRPLRAEGDLAVGAGEDEIHRMP
jgi:hypothetical protein